MYSCSVSREQAARLGPRGSRHAQTEKHATSICRAEPSRAEPSAAAAGSEEPASAPSALQSAVGSSLIHSLHKTTTTTTTTPFPLPGLPPPGFLPEAGRGLHLDVAASRRGAFPVLSVRHAAAL